jgi:tetratricopeptide (TPR) repeat protein
LPALLRFAFRGKEQDITKIAEALRVSTILQGSVRRAGSRIRVMAQLIDASDGSNLWSERYDRELMDVFAVQDEIATAIVEALQVKLTGKRSRPHQPNLPAYEALLKGRHQLAKSSPESWTRARENFEQSIVLDPDYAEPHAELGYYFFNLGFWGLRPATEAMPLARVEATRALELSPADPMAHIVLCVVAALYDCDWKQAEHEYRLGLAANPVPPIIRARLFYYLMPQGRFQEAVQEIKTALEQDPLNVPIRSLLSLSLNFAGLYDPAILEARKALEIDEKVWIPHWVIGQSLALRRIFAEAREPAEIAFRLAPWHPMVVGSLAGILACLGERERSDQLLMDLPETSSAGRVIYHLLGSETEAAADWYEKEIELRQPTAVPLVQGRVPQATP